MQNFLSEAFLSRPCRRCSWPS